MADESITREERYLEYLTGDRKGNVPKPITRRERYLYELCLKGMGGEISPEEIKNAVNEYLEKNPVKPGATTEQAQQIEQNKTDIASLKMETGSLKEDLSNKITKFYASSQGKTYLADSDNGKIQDMMLYGKSEQKQYSGKNIYYMDYEDYFQAYNGAEVTSTKFGYSVSGTFSDTGDYTLTNRYITLAPGTYKMLLKNISALRIGLSTRDYSSIVSIPAGKTDATFALDKETEICLTIIYSNTTANETNEIMLTNNLETTSYEPYTGGIPSPNPDYPQEIKSVVNPTVKVCGKNLLKATLQTATVNGVTCTNNGDGTYTLNGTASGGNPSFRIGKIIAKSGRKLVGSPGAAGSYVSYLPNGTWNNATEEKGDGSIISNIGKGTDEIAIVVLNGTTVNNLLFKPMLTTDLTATYDDFEPYHEQTVTLPYTLNAIPVSSGGNVTIDGQQYIADYVDVERGKLVKMVEKKVLNGTEDWKLGERSGNRNGAFYVYVNANIAAALCDKAIYESLTSHYGTFDTWYGQIRFYAHTNEMTLEEWCNFLSSNNHVVYIIRNTPEETDLTEEELQSFKLLQAYYPTTNISINSEQLDGYTVFNYPISMENGWNYVKQQIGDTREYIYDMDARTQDTDLQSAEAYVNSEYAVALTELEV